MIQIDMSIMDQKRRSEGTMNICFASHSACAPTVSPSITRSDKSAIWRSDDNSLLRPIGEGGGLLTPSLTTSFLSISGAALVEGSTYRISVSAAGSWIDQQVRTIRRLAPMAFTNVLKNLGYLSRINWTPALQA